MNLKRIVLQCVCMGLAAFGAAPVGAQSNCTSSADAAVQCFISNAVATKLAVPRQGMSLAQFQTYGVAVSQILQTKHTYLVLVTTASAVADAMPPTDASGTPDPSSQKAAIDAIVAAEFSNGFVNAPIGVSLLDLQRFTEDVAGAMNDNQGYMQLLTPGATLRLVDSWVCAATAANTVDWQKVQAIISSVVDTFTGAGIIKIPASNTTAELKAFMRAVAGVIYSYRTATGRNRL